MSLLVRQYFNLRYHIYPTTYSSYRATTLKITEQGFNKLRIIAKPSHYRRRYLHINATTPREININILGSGTDSTAKGL